MQCKIEILRYKKDLAERKLQFLWREIDLLRATEKRKFKRGSTRLKDVKKKNSMNKNYDIWGYPGEKQIKHLTHIYDLNNLETKTIICNKLRGKALKWWALNYSRTKCCVEWNAEDLLREL